MGLKKQTAADLTAAYILAFVWGFMLFVYEPVFMYAVNMDDFWFDFSIMVVPTLKIFGLVFGTEITAVTLFYLGNRIFDRKVRFYKIMILIGSLFLYLMYIQGNWLIKGLPPLDGSEIIWENYGKTENVIIIVTGIIICAAVILSVIKRTLEKTIQMLKFISLAVFVAISVSLISTIAGHNALKMKDGAVFSMKNFNSVSGKQNFIMFLPDAMDAGEFSRILSDVPEYKDIFADFTYYNNAVSVYPYTRDSVPMILSGNMNINEMEFSEYSSNAYNHSKLFAMLEEEGFGINLYDHELIWNGKQEHCISNAESIYNIDIELMDYAKQELRWVLFKYLPYSLKKYSNVYDMNFNKCYYNWRNDAIYSEIVSCSQLEQVTDNMFQFIHAEGAHEPFRYDKDLNVVRGGSYRQEMEAAITMLDAYLQRLKDNGAYDNSIIIILADHGYCTEPVSNLRENIMRRFNPVLLIKGYQESHELIETDIPVSYEDLTDVYRDLLDGKKSIELFPDIDKNVTRKVIYYEYLKENHMIEYETDGRAGDAAAFRETGRTFDR